MQNQFKTFLGCLMVGLSLYAAPPGSKFGVSGYYENWANFRGYQNIDGNTNSGWVRGTFPSCIPNGFKPIANQLTVLNYAFWFFNIDVSQGAPGTVTNDWKVYPTEQSDFEDWAGAIANQAADLKTINNNLVVMLSIGGWSFVDPSSYGATTATFFTKLLNEPNFQDLFIDSLCNNDQKTGWLYQKTPNGNYLFDGIDIDYEYPGQLQLGGSSTQNNPNASTDYAGFIAFISKLRTKFNKASENMGARKLYISITLPPFMPSNLASGSISAGNYPIDSINYKGQPYPAITIDPAIPSSYAAWYSIVANQCDWVNLMAYDMYGAGFSNLKVMYQAPLYNGTTTYNFNQVPDNSNNDAYSVDYAVNFWTTGIKTAYPVDNYIGVIPGNILLGLPAYGRGYGSASTVFNQNPIGQVYNNDGKCYIPFINPTGNPIPTLGSVPQPYTGQTGTAAYFEIQSLSLPVAKNSFYTNPLSSFGSDPNYQQSFFVANGINKTFDPPFNNVKQLPANNTWVYDSLDNIAEKVKYAMSQKLGGVVFYPLSMDNFSGAPTTGYNYSDTLFNRAYQTINQPSFSSFNGNTITSTTPN